ncbi:MAG TPA: Ig-like domain-containing protein, partial [Candidatus Thermoplasmatota archaeon]|nr:Ig-like domain-containing protein [Candidatus Thermoplasmatota archaeon]
PRDTFPEGLTLVAPVSPTNDNTPSYSGTARDVPVAAHSNFTSKGFQSVSINKVASVKWRIGSGTATTVAAAPADVFAAAFAFTTSALADGTRVVNVAAVNAVGNEDATPLSHTIVIDTVAPTVAVLTPTAGNAYVGPVGVALAAASPNPWIVGPVLDATASAGAGTGTAIAKVEFYDDGVLFMTDATAPYEGVGVTTALGGTHTLLVKAYDAAGNTASASRTYDKKP